MTSQYKAVEAIVENGPCRWMVCVNAYGGHNIADCGPDGEKEAKMIADALNKADAQANLLKSAKKAVEAMNQLIAESDDPFDMPPAWLDDLEIAVWAFEEEK